MVLAAKLRLWQGSQRCLAVVAAAVGVCMCVDCKSAGYGNFSIATSIVYIKAGAKAVKYMVLVQ